MSNQYYKDPPMIERINIEAGLEIAAQGGKTVDIARAMGCSARQFCQLKRQHADFAHAVDNAREQGYIIKAELLETLIEDNPLASVDELRLQFDISRFLLSKMYPAKFGEKLTLAVERVDLMGAMAEAKARALPAQHSTPPPITVLDVDPFEE